MTVQLMSDGELRRLEVLQDLDRRRLTAAAAGQLLGLERRQVFRLLKAYRIEGPTGLISKRRGRRSNRRKPEALRQCGSDDHPPVVLGFWPDFGGREVARGSWGHNWSGNAAPVDDRSRAVARSQATQTHPPTAAAARVRWRADSGRRQRALVVRGSRATMHLAGVCRRRDQPADASAVCQK